MPQRVKNIYKASEFYKYYKDLYNGQPCSKLIYYNYNKLGYNNFSYIKPRRRRL